MARRKYSSLEQYLEVNTNKNGPIPAYAPHLGPCWIWLGDTSRRGYGTCNYNYSKRAAHVVQYEQEKGHVPDGLELDHLCRVRACVRTSHLEPVTHTENIRRGLAAVERVQRTHCKCGCELSQTKTGRWYCKACGLKRATAHYDTYGRKQRAEARAERGDRPIEEAAVKAKGICKRGHPLDGVNSRGERYCMECYRVMNRELYHRKKLEQQEQ